MFNPLNSIQIERRNGQFFYHINHAGKMLYPLLPLNDYLFYNKNRINDILKKYNYGNYIDPKRLKITFKKNSFEIVVQINEKYLRKEVYNYKDGVIFENYIIINQYSRKYYNYNLIKFETTKSAQFTAIISNNFNNEPIFITNSSHIIFETDYLYDDIKSNFKNFSNNLEGNTTISENKSAFDNFTSFIDFQHKFIQDFDGYTPSLYGIWITDDEPDAIAIDTFYCNITLYIGICKDFKTDKGGGTFTLVYWDQYENKEIVEPIVYTLDNNTNNIRLRFLNYDEKWIDGKPNYFKNISGKGRFKS